MANITVKTNPTIKVTTLASGAKSIYGSTDLFAGAANTGDVITFVASNNSFTISPLHDGITSNTANLAFSQANIATNYANSASSYANSAFLQSNGAFVQANAAFNAQNTTASYANSAFIYANSAYLRGNSAGVYANGALVQANGAFLVSNSAFIQANAAYISQNTTGSYANSAFAQANAAFASANNVFPQVQPAFSTANSAALYANGAFIQANAAFSIANSAYGSQNTTGSYANSAYSQANTATTNAATADFKAVAAGSYANSAYTQANTATTNAATADSKAVTSGQYANSAYQSQNTTGSYANSAFASANSASLYANGAFVQANAAYNSQNTTGSYANSAFTFANSAGSYANSAFLKANASYAQANAAFLVANAAFPSSGGTITGTLTVTQDATINGNLTVLGTQTTLNTTSIILNDPLLYLANNNYLSDAMDIGIIAHYNPGANAHTGIFRDPNRKEWIFFEGYTPEVGSNNLINLADPSFAYANVYANTFKGNVIANNIYVSGYNVFTYITNAYTQANAAYGSQNTTGSYANSAYAQANGASIYANGAFAQANAAFASANNVFPQVQPAFSTANSAALYANGAFVQANSAYGSQNTTGSYANSAYSQANSASIYANGAFAQANAAFASANNVFPQVQPAFSTANSAALYANGAFIQANAAYSSQNTTGSYANSAFTSANNRVLKTGDTMTGDLLMTANIIPTVANTYYLGSALKPFRSIYVGPGSINIDGIVLGNTGSGTLTITSSGGQSLDLTQISLAANSAGSYANSAYAQANGASIYANGAFAQANASYNSQNTTGSYANSAYAQANGASIYANGAFIQANAAYGSQNTTGNYANSAYAQANGASIYANGAFNQANASFNKANSITSGWTANSVIFANTTGYLSNTSNLQYLTSNNTLIVSNIVGTSANTTITSNGFTTLFDSSGKVTIPGALVFPDGTSQTTASGTASTYANGAFTQANSAYAQANGASIYANGAFTQANSAYTQANGASIYANGAFIQANAAYGSQNTTGSYANSAFTFANSAGSYANSAFNYANSAYTQANTATTNASTADGKAVTAGSYANSAYTQANTATTNASTADGKAVTAGNYANSAFGVANTATSNASGASLYANGAFLQANASFGTANSAGSYANSSFGVANSAALYANSAFLQSNSSFGTANSGASYANSAFLAANTADSKAVTAGNYANSSYNQANTATTNAATADSKAVTAGGYANSAYAQANGASIYANGAFVQANAAYGSQNVTGLYANSAYAQANGASIYANGAFTAANNRVLKAGDTMTGALYINTGTALSLNTTGSIVVGGDINLTGNLNLSGSVNTYTANSISVTDPIIYIAANNSGDSVAIGLVAHFVGTGNTSYSHYQHTGLVRDNTDKKWKLFSNVVAEPTTTVNFDANTSYDTLKVGVIEAGSANVNNTDLFTFINNAYTQANNALPNTSSLITVNGVSQLVIANTAASTSNSTGALVVKGGIASNGAIYTTGGSITVTNGIVGSGQSGTINLGDGSFSKTYGSGWTFNGGVVSTGTGFSAPGAPGAYYSGFYFTNGNAVWAPDTGLIGLRANSSNSFVTSAPTGSVNYLQASGSITSNVATLSTQGTDTSVSLLMSPKGSGAFDIASSGGVNISNGGTVTAITRTAYGSGYTSLPTPSVPAPTTAGGVQAVLTTSYLLAVVATVGAGGTGYTVGDVLTLVGGTFSSATTVTVSSVSGGVVTGALISSNGNYSVAPAATAATTGGTGTGCTINISYGIYGVNITNAGSGYVEQPTVSFSGGGGSGATAYASVGSTVTIKGLYGGGAQTPIQFSGPNGAILQLVDQGVANPTPLVVKGNQIFPNGTNASLIQSSSGTGAILFYTNTLSTLQFQVTNTASAVNYVSVTGAATNLAPTISVLGSDGVVDLNLQAKSTGQVKAVNLTNSIMASIGQSGFGSFLAQSSTGSAYYFGYSGSSEVGRIIFGSSNTISFSTSTAATEQFRVAHTSSTVNYLQATGNTTGGGPVISSQGSDANIDVNVNSKGYGSFKINNAGGNVAEFNDGASGTPANPFLFAAGSTAGTRALIRAMGGPLTLLSTGSNPVNFATNGSSGNIQAVISHTASAVNYVNVTGAATGGAPAISAAGSDGNISLVVGTKGSSQLYLSAGPTGGTIRFNVLNAEQGTIGGLASAVNKFSLKGAISGSSPSLQSTSGTDTNVGFEYSTFGTGAHTFYTFDRNSGSTNVQFSITHSNNAVNYVQVTGGSTANAVVISSQGTDTNASMAFLPKGTGAFDIQTANGVNISNGNTVTSIQLITGGGGYLTTPTITIAAPTTANGVTATANAYVGLWGATLASAGSGYTLNDIITFVGGVVNNDTVQYQVTSVNGTGAILTTSIYSNHYGNYWTPPTGTVSVTGGTGTGATFSSVTWTVYGINLLTSGSGYVEQPAITIGNGGGTPSPLANAYTRIGTTTVIKGLGTNINFATPSGTGFTVVDGGVTPVAWWGALGTNNVADFRTQGGGVTAGAFTTQTAIPLLFRTNFTQQFAVSHTASAVNYVQVTGAATGSSPSVLATGSDASVPLILASKGGSSISFQTNGVSSSIQFLVTHTSSVANYIQTTGSTTGNAAKLLAGGSDTNIDLSFITKGTGGVNFQTGATSATQLRVSDTASAVNYVQVTGSVTGNAPIISAIGSDTNIQLQLQSKGTGLVRFVTGSGLQAYVQDIASPINYLGLSGAGSGGAPKVLVSGSDSDIDLSLVPKGAGRVITSATLVAGLISGGTF
jgi:hypothetical protein